MRVPKYRDNGDGRAFVEYQKKKTYLGKYGDPESKRLYREFVANLFLVPTAIPNLPQATVAQICARYLEFAEGYYQDDGLPSQEFVNVKTAVAALLDECAAKPAKSLGPATLLAIQANLIRAGHCRTTINSKVSRIKRCLRWCASRELIGAEVIAAMWTVDGLRRGRTRAIEPEPVTGVPLEHVAATLPFVSPIVAAMIQVQYHCGMRPGEVCRMQSRHLRRDGEIWIYEPPQHKGAWRGKSLIKAVPPAAQAILEPFLTADPDAPLFTTAASKAWWQSQRERQCKVFPCELRKRAARRREAPRAFTTASYGKAIVAGIAKAAKQGVVIPPWAPNQLRHSIGTHLSQSQGQQAAQRWLGHTRLETTAIYDELQAKELIEIARKLPLQDGLRLVPRG